MNKSLAIFIAMGALIPAWGQESSLNVQVVTTYDRPGTLAASGGIWGYTGTDGKEYALYTIQQPGGLAVLEIFDGKNPVVPPRERGYIPAGHNSLWQEVAGCGHYAYRVSQEGSMGLQIVDLSPLNTGGNAKEVVKMNTHFRVAHQIYCDETVTPPRLFVAAGGNAGAKIFSLENPASPKMLYDVTGETHDMFGRGNRLFTYKGGSGTIFLYDISNPSSPQRVGTITPTPSGYMHQGWLSDDGKHLFVATETANVPLLVYDVSTPARPVKVGQYAVQAIGNRIIHNVYVKGKELYVGHYHAGLRVLDISNPASPVEFAHHKVSTSTAQWGGTWGVYPWFKSGLVIYGEMQRGMYVVRVTNPATSINARIALPGRGAGRTALYTLDGRAVHRQDAGGAWGMRRPMSTRLNPGRD